MPLFIDQKLALQEGRNKIRVNVVCPGQTATDAVMNNMSEEFQNFFYAIRRLKEWESLKKLQKL